MFGPVNAGTKKIQQPATDGATAMPLVILYTEGSHKNILKIQRFCSVCPKLMLDIKLAEGKPKQPSEAVCGPKVISGVRQSG